MSRDGMTHGPLRSGGFTLLELLVAMGIFVLLGAALVSFLRGGVRAWRIAESRREVYERAQVILTQIAADLRSTYTDSRVEPDVRFVSSYDSSGRPYFQFVRTIEGGNRSPFFCEAGLYAMASADYDLRNDALEHEWRILRAPGGLMEVSYHMDPDPAKEVLWRAVRSPIGGDLSLLRRGPGGGHPFSSSVMHLEFLCWSQYTDTWDPAVPLRIHPVRDERSGPALVWDSRSVRSIGGGAGSGMPGGGAAWPEDDIFPSKVQVVLVLEPRGTEVVPRLARDLSATATDIPFTGEMGIPDGKTGFVKVGGEWIFYADRGPGVLKKAERGRRRTRASEHDRGTPLRFGTVFRQVVEIPSYRECWAMEGGRRP